MKRLTLTADILQYYIGCGMYRGDNPSDTLTGICYNGNSATLKYKETFDSVYLKDNILDRPYLRSLKSMTEEEKIEYHSFLLSSLRTVTKIRGFVNVHQQANITKWLCDRHFDLFDLIENSLAIDKDSINK